MRPLATFALVVSVGTVAGAGGYLLGARAVARSTPIGTRPTPAIVTAPAATAAALRDDLSRKAQLAICMAYRVPDRPDVPGHDLLTDALAGCESQLELERKEKPTYPSCYDFEDASPTYDREFGAAGDTSPEMTERAAHVTLDECGPIMDRSGRADARQRRCLKGDTPRGWRERFGSPIEERPLVKACRAAFSWPDLSNAMAAFEEQQIRDRGGVIRRSIRMTPDGGHVAGPVDPEPVTP